MPSPDMTQSELIQGVRAHAHAHLDDGRGWDVMLETWDDTMIRRALGRSKKFSGAIWAVGEHLKPIVARRRAALEQAELLDIERGQMIHMADTIEQPQAPVLTVVRGRKKGKVRESKQAA